MSCEGSGHCTCSGASQPSPLSAAVPLLLCRSRAPPVPSPRPRSSTSTGATTTSLMAAAAAGALPQWAAPQGLLCCLMGPQPARPLPTGHLAGTQSTVLSGPQVVDPVRVTLPPHLQIREAFGAAHGEGVHLSVTRCSCGRERGSAARAGRGWRQRRTLSALTCFCRCNASFVTSWNPW